VKHFFGATALFFLLISCSSAEKLPECHILAEVYNNDARDQILMEACLGEISTSCSIMDKDCQISAALACTEAFLTLKVEQARGIRVQQCWK
jgi:hypothetical protein